MKNCKRHLNSLKLIGRVKESEKQKKTNKLIIKKLQKDKKLTHDLISMAQCSSIVTRQDVVIVVPNSHIPTSVSQ